MSNYNAAFACIKHKNKILSICRKDGTYGLIGGKLDNGETPLQCIEREFFEETGLILHIGSNYISEYENNVNNKLVICYYIDEKALHSKYLNLKSWLGPEKTKVMWNKPEVLLESYLEFNKSAFKTFDIL
jgi:8-oxo-dGTP pyrophosphatase MutT (NUDIX family)